MADSSIRLCSGVYSGYEHNPEKNALRRNGGENFHVWHDPLTRDISSLYRESMQAAQEFRASTDKEIVVLYSGGMDSEWVLESFVAAGIPVTPLVVVYKNGLNDHDVQWANRYLNRRNMPAIYHELDLAEWFKSDEIREIARTAQTPELAYTAQFKAILTHMHESRVFVTGYDEPLIIAKDEDNGRNWYLTYAERHFSVTKFFDQYNVPGCPHFSRWSQHLWASYVTNPINQTLVAGLHNPQIWQSEAIKTQLFRLQFPFMEARAKYTGFEGALDFLMEGSKRWQSDLMEEYGYKWATEWERNVLDVWSDIGVWKK